MYRLYGNIGGWKDLNVSKDEIDIINSIGNYMNAYSDGVYVVNEYDGKSEFPIKLIKNERDYNDYLQEYQEKHNNVHRYKRISLSKNKN